MDDKDRRVLQKLQTHTESILRYRQDCCSLAEFEADSMRVEATVFNLMQIGELATTQAAVHYKINITFWCCKALGVGAEQDGSLYAVLLENWRKNALERVHSRYSLETDLRSAEPYCTWVRWCGYADRMGYRGGRSFSGSVSVADPRYQQKCFQVGVD